MKSKWTVGTWIVDVEECSIRKRGLLSRLIRVDHRLCRVLEVLINHAGAAVSPEQILHSAWKGRVVSLDSVSTAIYQIRKLLGDSSKSPDYILTVPNKGYRLVAATKPLIRGPRIGIFSTASTTAALAVCLVTISAFLGLHALDSPGSLFVPPMVNSTGDPSVHDLSIAVDATFVSALVRANPNIVATRSQDAQSTLRLESEIVACDAGPTLVLTLIDTKSQQFLWSEYYDFYGSYDESSMVEHAAKRVTRVLSET